MYVLPFSSSTVLSVCFLVSHIYLAFCCRDFSYYDHNIYSLHGSAILEDLIINLADAISSVYLEVISVDSETSEKISNYSLSLCTLSARALQKLRNEVFVFFGSFIFFHVLLKLFLNFQKLILQCFHKLCFDCEWVFTDIMAISFEEKLKQLLLWSFIIKGNNLFFVPCSRIQIDKLSLLYISLPVAPPLFKIP